MWLFIPDADPAMPVAAKDWLFNATVPFDWLFSRAGTALARGDDGRWLSYATDIPRPGHDPVTRALVPGFWIEPSATQIVYGSRPFVHSTLSAVTAASSGTQTPFGTGATLYSPTTTTTIHSVNLNFGSLQAASIADNETVAIRLCIAPTGIYTRAYLFMTGRDNINRSILFSMTGAGEIISQTGCAGSIVSDTDGFYDVQMIVPVSSGTAAPVLALNFSLDDGTRSFPGVSSSGFLVSYLGVETGTVCTSPIISSGASSVIRPADSLTSSGIWWPFGDTTIGIDYTPLAVASQTILHAQSQANDTVILSNAASTVQYYSTGFGSLSANLSGAAPPNGQRRTVVFTTASDQFRLAQNGAQIGIDTEGAIPGDMSSVRIGALTGGGSGGGMIVHRVKYWSQVLGKSSVLNYSTDLSQAGDVVPQGVIAIQSTRTVIPSENILQVAVTIEGDLSGAGVQYRTVDGTAKAGVDYVGESGSLMFSVGQTDAIIDISLAERGTAADKTFRIELYNPVNATILGSGLCEVTLSKVIPQGTPATTQALFAGSMPSGFTLIRASTAMARGSDGIWTTIQTDGYRHHYVAPGISGLLIEGASSEQDLFDSVDPGWVAVESTKAMNNVTQTQTGTRSLNWRESATANVQHTLSLTLTSSNSEMTTGEFTAWMMVKPVGGRTRLMMRVKGIDNIWNQVRVDLTGNGSVTEAPFATNVYISPDPFFAGWYTIGLHRTQAATAGVSAEIVLTLEDSSGLTSYTGATTAGLDISHVQVSPGGGIFSPIVASAKTAKTSRAADILRATTTDGWYKVASYGIGIRFIRLNPSTTSQRLVMIKDLPTSSGFQDQIDVLVINNTVRAATRVATVAQPDINALAPNVAGTLSTAVLTVDAASRVAFFLDGVKAGQVPVGTGGVPAPIVPTSMRFGGSEPSGFQPGTFLIQAIYHWPAPLNDDDGLVFSGSLTYSPPPSSPTVSIPLNLEVAEGGTINVQVTKTGSGACSVDFRTKSASASYNVDYTGVGPVAVSFGASETLKTVAVSTIADTTADPDETFGIILEAPVNCTLGNASGTVKIVETTRLDMPSTYTATEGSPATITITKSGSTACSATYRTQAVTATAGTDYTNTSGTTVSFTATETSKVISINTTADSVADPNETFNVILENGVDCAIGTSGSLTCEVTIVQPGDTPPDQGTLYDPMICFANTASDGKANDFGIGYEPYYVTSTSWSTETQGTFGHAMSSGNRIILFEVGGVIKLPRQNAGDGTKLTTFGQDNIYVAGETAPYPGITICGGTFKGNGSSNVCYRHISFERGYDYAEPDNSNADAFQTSSSSGVTTSKIWFDHCAFLWGNDECIEMWRSNDGGTVENISFTNCVIGEGLYRPEEHTNPYTNKAFKGHYEGSKPERDHNYGHLIGYGCKRIDVQHCLYLELYWRNPWVDGNCSAVLANNIGLNNRLGIHIALNGSASSKTNGYKGPMLVTCVGYLKINGKNSNGKLSGFKLHNGSYVSGTKVYVRNLYADRGSSSYDMPDTVVWGKDNSAILKDYEKDILVDSKPIDIPTAPVSALSKDDLYERCKKNVGPQPKLRVPAHKVSTDPRGHMSRIVKKLEAKDGSWVDVETEVGGFSNHSTTKRSLRDGTGKFVDGTSIPAFPTHTDKTAVRKWLRRFLNDVQYD